MAIDESYPVFATGKLGDHELTDIDVINPGGWWGKVWLIEIGGSYWPLFLAVEADHIEDALEELAEHPKFGHNIKIDIDVAGADYGFEVSRGDIIGGHDIEEDGWLNLKGEFFKERPPCVSEPWTTGHGEYCDLDHVAVHGQERSELPWPCIYTSPGDPLVPPEGMSPLIYHNREYLAEEVPYETDRG